MSRRCKQIEPKRVDATHVVPLQGDTVTIEELEDLDGHLATAVNAVAKLRGRENAVPAAGRKIGRDGYHLMHRWAQKEMIVRDLIHPAKTSSQLEKPTDVTFRIRRRTLDIADTWRPKPRLAVE